MSNVTTHPLLPQAMQFLSEEKFDQAVLTYETILHEAPHHADALNNAAVAYQKLGRYHITQDYLERALDADPSHTNAFFNLVELLVKLKRPIEAALAFDQYQHHIPDRRKKAQWASELWPSLPTTPPVLTANGSPNVTDLELLASHWCHDDWAAPVPYLHTMIEQALKADGPILECGSGLTTLILGYVAQQHDVEVWALEHHGLWHAYMSCVLQRFNLEHVHLLHAPLARYGDADWYDLTSLDLPNAFGLVVCDGPPSTTRGGRAGLFPAGRGRFADACTILLRNAQNDEESKRITLGAKASGFSTHHVSHDGNTLSMIMLSRTEAPRTAVSSTAPQDRAIPPRARTMQHYLADHPSDARIFLRLVDLLLGEGFADEATEIYLTYEANIPESPGKQALCDQLHIPSPRSRPDHLGPIVIGGCGSSGTNLLRRLLDAHAQIACGKELSLFDHPALYQLQLDELRAMYLSGDYSALEKGVPFPMQLDDGTSYVGLRPGNHGDFFHTIPNVLDLFDASSSVADFLDRYLLQFAHRKGKSIWVEKTPNNIYCAEPFLAMYPKGRFIQMLRDGRDVTLSLHRRRDFLLSKALVRWTCSVEAGMAITDHERVYTLRYEDLVHTPEASLTALMDWLGLSYDPGMLDFTEKNESNMHGYAEKPIHSDSAYRWKRAWPQLEKSVRAHLDLCLRRHLMAAGYETESSPSS